MRLESWDLAVVGALIELSSRGSRGCLWHHTFLVYFIICDLHTIELKVCSEVFRLEMDKDMHVPYIIMQGDAARSRDDLTVHCCLTHRRSVFLPFFHSSIPPIFPSQGSCWSIPPVYSSFILTLVHLPLSTPPSSTARPVSRYRHPRFAIVILNPLESGDPFRSDG